MEKQLENLPLGRILAIDFGQIRIGLAVSDPSQTIASTLSILKRQREEDITGRIVGIIQEQQAIGIVIGNPLNMNGTTGARAKEVAVFIASLAAVIDKPIFTWDERWTTVSAHKSLHDRGKKPSRLRGHVDQIAAAFILQSFLDRLSFFRHRSQ